MKPKPIQFADRLAMPLKYGEKNVRKQLRERFAKEIAKRIVFDWDKLVNYDEEINKEKELVLYARITIMGDDVKYENPEK